MNRIGWKKKKSFIHFFTVINHHHHHHLHHLHPEIVREREIFFPENFSWHYLFRCCCGDGDGGNQLFSINLLLISINQFDLVIFFSFFGLLVGLVSWFGLGPFINDIYENKIDSYIYFTLNSFIRIRIRMREIKIID